MFLFSWGEADATGFETLQRSIVKKSVCFCSSLGGFCPGCSLLAKTLVLSGMWIFLERRRRHHHHRHPRPCLLRESSLSLSKAVAVTPNLRSASELASSWFRAWRREGEYLQAFLHGNTFDSLQIDRQKGERVTSVGISSGRVACL